MLNQWVTEQEFDPKRAIIREQSFFPPLFATLQNTFSLQDAVADGKIAPQDPMLFLVLGESSICIPLIHIIFHHVAQGIHEGTPWIMSFCSVCNGGMAFSSLVEGTRYEFAEKGFFNAMFLMVDKNTHSVWNHITGFCLDGVHKGYRLASLEVPLQKTAQQILAEYPHTIVTMGHLSNDDLEYAAKENATRLDPTYALLSVRWENTLYREDPRLPRLEMGLGVWTADTKRYYPYRTIVIHNALLDQLDGRNVIIHSSPSNVAPEIFYTRATHIEWQRDTLHLNTGEILRAGILYDAKGTVMIPERPHQLFQRWYSFAILFPNCQIYS